MKNVFIQNVKTLIGIEHFDLSDKEFKLLEDLIKADDYALDSMQAAIYAAAVMVFDKADVITERNQRDLDLPVIGDCFALGYATQPESEEEIKANLREALSGYIEVDVIDTAFEKAILEAEETAQLLNWICQLPKEE